MFRETIGLIKIVLTSNFGPKIDFSPPIDFGPSVELAKKEIKVSILMNGKEIEKI